MAVNIIIGGQWGDEGKAKIIDYLSEKSDIIVRYQGGPNAGHTVIVDDQKFIFHLIPSGILYPDKICVVGNGVVINLDIFFKEIDNLNKRNIDIKNRIFVSDSSHIILPFHEEIDSAKEALLKDNKIGTTKKGIGFCYSDKMMRVGLRVGDLLDKNHLLKRLNLIIELKNQELEKLYNISPVNIDTLYENLLGYGEKIRPMVTNTSYFLTKQLEDGKEILLEGAQGIGLDIDHGTYPYVTSSNPSIGGAMAGSGINLHHFKDIYAVVKGYVTRVGGGPFPTELGEKDGEKVREAGKEYGATTGRPRRCGWFDMPILKHGIRVNGYTGIALTKIDILNAVDTIKIGEYYTLNGQKLEEFPSLFLDKVEVKYLEFPSWDENISNIRNYEDLPKNCKNFIGAIEELSGIPVKIISLGPERKETIIR
jgi:adenylosuccinate synthase